MNDTPVCCRITFPTDQLGLRIVSPLDSKPDETKNLGVNATAELREIYVTTRDYFDFRFFFRLSNSFRERDFRGFFFPEGINEDVFTSGSDNN